MYTITTDNTNTNTNTNTGALLALAWELYDATVRATDNAELAERRMAELPLSNGECPCLCGRQSAQFAARHADKSRRLAGDLIRQLEGR